MENCFRSRRAPCVSAPTGGPTRFRMEALYHFGVIFNIWRVNACRDFQISSCRDSLCSEEPGFTRLLRESPILTLATSFLRLTSRSVPPTAPAIPPEQTPIAFDCPEIAKLSCYPDLSGYPVILDRVNADFRRPHTLAKGDAYFDFHSNTERKRHRTRRT